MKSADSAPPPTVAWNWRGAALACAAYGALAVALTWPLVRHLGSAVPHDAEDPLLSAAILWWNAHVLPLTARWLDGFFFYPAGGALTFSDHRLGLMPLAAPLLWLGASPILTYNLVFLATYPLTAVAAHGLAYTLTRRHDAAAICGLAFGFSPFRVEHLPHLELLAAFGMPVALWALHRYWDTRRLGWLAAFGGALVVQGLSASYYLLFFFVLVGLWLLWFARPREWRRVAGAAAACAASVLLLAPLAIAYTRVHQQLGLSRSYGEIVSFSADVVGLFSASRLIALWGWTSAFTGNETRIFLGSTILVLIAAAIVRVSRSGGGAGLSGRGAGLSGLRGTMRALLAVAAVFAAAAAFTAVHGPWHLRIGPLGASGSVVYKPLTIALLALVACGAVSAPLRAAYRARSPFAFYTLAGAVLLIFSMGPAPKFFGHQFMYESPYALLMHLPVFGSGVRVPARFAMPAALALSLAASLAFVRLTAAGSSAARTAIVLVAIGIVADTFVPGIPLAPIPGGWNPARAAGFAAVVELPLGGTGEDVEAMYHAVAHGRPTVNGYSGYDPPHYAALRAAVAERDPTAIDAIAAAAGPLLMVVDTRRGADWEAFAASHRGAEPLGSDGPWTFFALPGGAAPVPTCNGSSLPIAAASGDAGPVDVAALTDGRPSTWWSSAHPQRPGDRLVMDLGRVAAPCAVTLSQTGFARLYPRGIEAAISVDGDRWRTVFSGRTGGLVVRDALAHGANPRLVVPLDGGPARFIRIAITIPSEEDPWVVTDVAVRGK